MQFHLVDGLAALETVDHHLDRADQALGPQEEGLGVLGGDHLRVEGGVRRLDLPLEFGADLVFEGQVEDVEEFHRLPDRLDVFLDLPAMMETGDDLPEFGGDGTDIGEDFGQGACGEIVQAAAQTLDGVEVGRHPLADRGEEGGYFRRCPVADMIIMIDDVLGDARQGGDLGVLEALGQAGRLLNQGGQAAVFSLRFGAAHQGVDRQPAVEIALAAGDGMAGVGDEVIEVQGGGDGGHGSGQGLGVAGQLRHHGVGLVAFAFQLFGGFQDRLRGSTGEQIGQLVADFIVTGGDVAGDLLAGLGASGQGLFDLQGLDPQHLDGHRGLLEVDLPPGRDLGGGQEAGALGLDLLEVAPARGQPLFCLLRLVHTGCRGGSCRSGIIFIA